MVRSPVVGTLVLFLVASQPVPVGLPAGSGAGHRRTRPSDRGGLRRRAAGREAAGVRLLQRRRGPRPAFHRIIRLLAFARISKQEGCRRRQECDGDRGGRRRASVALRIWSPRPCSASRGIDCHRRTTAASRSRELRCGALVRCHAARRQFAGTHTPGSRGLVRAGGRAVPGDAGWRQQGAGRGHHDGAGEYANGVERHWYDAPARIRPGHS